MTGGSLDALAIRRERLARIRREAPSFQDILTLRTVCQKPRGDCQELGPNKDPNKDPNTSILIHSVAHFSILYQE